jgi:hypothetical protein
MFIIYLFLFLLTLKLVAQFMHGYEDSLRPYYNKLKVFYDKIVDTFKHRSTK